MMQKSFPELQLILLEHLNKQQETLLMLQHQNMAVISDKQMEYLQSKTLVEDHEIKSSWY